MSRKLKITGGSFGLDDVLAEYMRRVDAGERIDNEAFIKAHPLHAAELRDYFSQALAVEQFAATATADFGAERTARNALVIRCPHCHERSELAVDAPLTDIVCKSCGSQFSLVDQNKETWTAPPLSMMGRFELVERLGVGGFGSVWKARDKERDRTVAIKVPRHGGMNAQEQEKFFREARAAAQLRHPNIVSVYEVGRDGDSVYIVSEFIRGVTLGDWLRDQQLTSREAAELCAKIADALHHAHEQGVVHRGLKPANIMMDQNGEPHLMDFGLARREVGEVTVTVDGQVLGTPAYMSPEQAQGEAHQADRRSDVYSLGVILFQQLTGELPFRGNARMLLHQVVNDEAPSPRKLNANVAKDLETVTLKCLDKDPSRRYQSAESLAAELRRFLAAQPIEARSLGPIERALRWYTRNTSAVYTTAGGYAIILTIILFLWDTAGLLLIATGAIQASARIVAEMAILTFVFYPVMLLVGLSTLKGNAMAVTSGAIIATLWTLSTLLAMLKVDPGPLRLELMLASQSDPYFHYQLAILLLLLSSIGMVLYVAAFVTSIRAMRQSRAAHGHRDAAR